MVPARRRLPCFILWAGFLACAAGYATKARAAEHYFVIFFASQSEPWRPKYTHTFGSIIRATGEGPDLETYDLVVHTGSWLPRTGDVKVWRLRSEPGRIFRLFETLDLVRSTGQKVYQWGPYPIRAVSYWRGINRIKEFESGAFRYRAIDTLRESNIVNCFHAISDMDPTSGRRYYPLREAGYRATWKIVHSMYEQDVFLDVCTDHAWLTRRLGLDRYPICRQGIEACGPPRPAAISVRIHASPPRIPPCIPAPDLVIPGCKGPAGGDG